MEILTPHFKSDFFAMYRASKSKHVKAADTRKFAEYFCVCKCLNVMCANIAGKRVHWQCLTVMGDGNQ